MHQKRSLTVFALAFVAVLLGGAAIAGVGAVTSEPEVDKATAPALSDATLESDYEAKPAEPDKPKSTITIVTEKVPTATEPKTEKPTDEAPKLDDSIEAKEAEVDRRLSLSIISPEQGAEVTEPVIRVKGRTHPRAVVSLGDQTAEVGADGLWVMKVELEPGLNELVFVAELGDQRTRARLLVTYRKVTDKRFTAHQRWETSDDNPATNVYYGTGIAGTRITVRSEYGGDATRVNERGDWKLRVVFPEAPCNEWFKVRVSDEKGQNRDFRMKRICKTDRVFTAHQKWERVDGDPAVNLYYGTARPGAEVWVGSEYGRGHTEANADGKWELKVEFPKAPCNEAFRVAAESGDARVEFKMKRVCERDHKFTANQRYGSCSEAVPYDIFWGTGIPETTITVRSEHGGGTTVVGDSGTWELKVKFPTAPPNETFKVLVTDGEGGEAVFTFTNKGGGGDH